MNRKARWLMTIGALALAAAPIGCGGDDDAQAELDREMDLALAQADSAALADVEEEAKPAPAPQPETQTQAPAPRPQPTRPAPTPEPKPEPKPDPGPQFAEYTVQQGTRFQATLDQELSTKWSQVGDLFTATVTSPVQGGGEVVIPAGTKIRGEVTAAQASGGSGKPAVLTVRFTDFTVAGQTYPIDLSITETTVETVGRDNTGDKVLKIGGGAAAGALIGQLLGKNTGATLAGAAVGAAVGTGLQMTTEDVDAIIREGTPMTVETNAPITVRKQVS